MRSTKGFLTMAAAAALVATTGCERSGGVSDTLSGGRSAQAKLNAYTKGYNVVIGTYGLRAALENYERGHIMDPKPEPEYVILSNGRLDEARSELKAAHAMPAAGLGDVDAAANRFIPDLDKVMAHATELNSYYTSKAWRDDGLARGRREDPVLVSEFHKAIAEGDVLEAALDKARDQREAAELNRLKTSGDLLGYDTKLAISQARVLASGFNSEASLHDPQKIAQADLRAVDLQKTLADQHAQVIKAKAKSGGAASGSVGIADFRVDTFGRASDELDEMLGHYRDLKAGGGLDAYNAMISTLNSAIGDANAAVMN